MKNNPKSKSLTNSFWWKTICNAHGGRYCALREKGKKNLEYEHFNSLGLATIGTPDMIQILRFQFGDWRFKKFCNFAQRRRLSLCVKKNWWWQKLCYDVKVCTHTNPARKHGTAFFKTSFDGKFGQVNYLSCRRGQKLNWPEDVQLVKKQKIPINRKNYNDLMELLPQLPSVCQEFAKRWRCSNVPGRWLWGRF